MSVQGGRACCRDMQNLSVAAPLLSRPASRALWIIYDTNAEQAPIMNNASASSTLACGSSKSGWRMPLAVARVAID